MKSSFNKVSVFILALVLTFTGIAIWFWCCFAPSPKDIRHVILISIDTCRADYLSCYGYPHRITPNIDDVADNGILFENVISPVPITLPAHCSMLTGLNPLHHQIHDNLGYKLGASNVTIAEVMSDNGYKTAAIVSSFTLDSQFGLDQGFDVYNDTFEDKITTGRFSERRGGEASLFAISWLKKHKDDDFFFFLHYYDPHFRYEPPEPFASEFADDLYAGEVAYTDHCIGQVIDALKKLGLFDSALLIITADHGEMLGEHGEAEHGYFIYQSAIKVPLIFKLPDQNKSQRIKSLVSLNDIVPTICSIAGIPSPSDIQGGDLSVFWSDEKTHDDQRFLYCESITPTKHNANALLGIVTDGWKYIQTTRPELYNLSENPDEDNNVVEDEPQRAHLLSEHLKLILEKRSGEGDPDSKLELDEQTRRRLESLGYIASGSVDDRLEFDQSKADPKDLIKFHNIKAYNEWATGLAQQDKLKEASDAYEELIQHYEKAEIQHAMGTIHFNLAVIMKNLGKQQQADEHFVRAVEEFRFELADDPNSEIICTRLGNALASMGDFNSAAQHFRDALILDPAKVLTYDNLARALELQGYNDEAIQVLKDGIQFMYDHQRKGDALKLQEHLEQIQSQKTEREE